MSLKIVGPDIGERIGYLSVRDANEELINLSAVPGEKLVMVMFRGHW